MRVKRGVAGRRRRKKVLKAAKGFTGGRKRLIRSAYSTVDRSLRYAFRDRRVKKRDFRALWITRLGIAVQELNTSYSTFMGALKKKNIVLDRKVLSEIAIQDPKGFEHLVNYVMNESSCLC